MGKRSGANQGPNPARVAATQDRLRSGAYGSHQQPEDRPRSARERAAVEDQHEDPLDDQHFDWEDDNNA